MTSAEMRWFFKGIIHNDILQFFKNNNIVFQEEEPREDWYLVNSDKFTSVKLRNNNFEVKRFIGNTENFQVNQQVRGNLEKWIKFSFPISDSAQRADISNGKYKQWLKVEKRRSVSKYEITENGKLKVLTDTNRRTEICILEICFIKVMNLDFWTLCLEASENESSVQRNLENALKQIFTGTSEITLLKTENSYSYPEFLSKLSLL